ncbi:hypothetical protein BBJ28_00014539 [Nothophytophthora sp. Chile5]|nr:hypothetical protein BBJ28_00014539 [Nothophytophthora sp. Chile5]
MRQLLILLAHHPLKIGAFVLLLSVFYSFARVLALQYFVGALRDAIHRYPKNFPHGFFLPLLHVSLASAALAALYEDHCHGRFWSSSTSAQLWKHVLPLPLTLHGKWSRLVGVPVYAFVVACVEAVLVFRNPSMESAAMALARNYLHGLPSSVDEAPTKIHGMLIRRPAEMVWKMLVGDSPMRRPTTSTLSFVRLPVELALAAAVCVSYGLARFFQEPQHGKDRVACHGYLATEERGINGGVYFADGDELREAARNNDILGVKLLLARGMNPNASSGDGTTALHICGQQAIDRAAQVLLEHGADANVSDRLGFTPLHWAVQMRREEVSTSNRLATIRILLHHGANPRKPDSCGTTALAIASRKENEASLEVLKEMLQEEEAGSEAQATDIQTIDGRDIDTGRIFVNNS